MGWHVGLALGPFPRNKHESPLLHITLFFLYSVPMLLTSYEDEHYLPLKCGIRERDVDIAFAQEAIDEYKVCVQLKCHSPRDP